MIPHVWDRLRGPHSVTSILASCDWLPYGQDGAILPARDMGFVPQVYRSCFDVVFPYNKSFIDQAYSVKMAGYWPRSFLRVSRNKKTWPIFSHLDLTLGQ